MDYHSKQLSISIEQSKLLGSALRVKILHALEDVPKTAKQVADQLGQTPGNIHYHIQRLYEGQLIDLIETKEIGGIVEKYYRAKSTWFNLKSDSKSVSGDASATRITTRLLLTTEQLEQFQSDLRDVLDQWGRKSPQDDWEGLLEYTVDISLREVNHEEPSLK
ncbi:ArsR/SmtB family transcription factor [Halalkalibacterium halodurans]|uniref:Helix-turn-helix domain-containing protein n=1 Tax=Halalkalibacterium halodurans TaxID=86665 RepID=A0A0M0KDF5_ALKHA|nr:winged helix-turn-helix domain-containing protein [Halalkalibacterium halodurans]TPE68861.1 winged helix-turn-helix transcriptional regulator [Halalkalibacterium halodurans]